MKSSCLMIENCNFYNYPRGGQLSFAFQMMHSFGNRLALVGISTDDTPIGEWLEKDIDGIRYNFFSVGKRKPSVQKPVIPERISIFNDLMRHKREILSLGIDSVFIQSPEILMVVSRWQLNSICYRFPGVENPLIMSRYAWGKILASVYDREWFKALKKVDLILASADENSINDLIDRSKGNLIRECVIKFPTRVDTSVFYPAEKDKARLVLDLLANNIIIVNCGRINRVKGWDFLLESFSCFQKIFSNSKLIFVGDGEDRVFLDKKVLELGLGGKVFVTGFQDPKMVATYMNASDLVIVGSYKEGWSIALIEALACGKSVVSTNISGVGDLIKDGKNGFIVGERSPKIFATAMKDALKLPDPNETSIAVSEKYTLKHLRQDLSELWKPLS